MAEIHHLKPNNISSESSVSEPTLTQIHHLKANDIEAQSEVSSPTLTISDVIDKVELSDVASKAEKSQIRRWFEDHFEEASNSPESVIDAMQRELSEHLSAETLQWLIELLSSLFT